ncbi:MAG: aminotransferase class I/II-fold pyridoxal phosphate-dependent enzyme [Chlorobi bacterium]|nr:aminotransferase class I/II-fold pyridoxal phosphate-dependent enzyme [Chlorobiota bacterium]
MPDTYIPLHEPLLGREEERAAAEVIASGKLGPDKAFNSRFERLISDYTGSSHAVALQSGTAALHVLLDAMGIGPGDHVIVPTHTFVATASPVLYRGAVPVFTEIETDTFNLSPRHLVRTLDRLARKGIKPKAVIAVHMYGLPAPIREIKEITDARGIPLIEDAAEAVGTRIGKRHAGTFGKAGFFSFNANKIVVTSGGGALLTADEDLARTVRFLSGHAREDKPYYFHTRLGYNYHMGNLQAAVGMAQFRKLEDLVERKRRIHAFYKQAFSELPVRLIDERPDTRSNYWLNLLLLPDESADALVRHLQSRGIDARHTWYPLHRMPLFDKYPYFGDEETFRLFTRGAVLPSGPGLTENQLARVAEGVYDFFKKYV